VMPSGLFIATAPWDLPCEEERGETSYELVWPPEAPIVIGEGRLYKWYHSHSLFTSSQSALLPRAFYSVLLYFRLLSFLPPLPRLLSKRSKDRDRDLSREPRRNSATMSSNVLVRICGPKLLRAVITEQKSWVTVSRCLRFVEKILRLIFRSLSN